MDKETLKEACRKVTEELSMLTDEEFLELVEESKDSPFAIFIDEMWEHGYRLAIFEEAEKHAFDSRESAKETP